MGGDVVNRCGGRGPGVPLPPARPCSARVSRKPREMGPLLPGRWQSLPDMKKVLPDVQKPLRDVSRRLRDVWQGWRDVWQRLRDVWRHLRDVWQRLRDVWQGLTDVWRHFFHMKKLFFEMPQRLRDKGFLCAWAGGWRWGGAAFLYLLTGVLLSAYRKGNILKMSNKYP